MKIASRFLAIPSAMLMSTRVALAVEGLEDLHPEPPPGIGEKLIMIGNWVLFVFALVFALGIVYGVIKIMQGDKRDGARYLFGGAIGEAVIGSIYAIVNGLLSA